jgi:hypothetical protein
MTERRRPQRPSPGWVFGGAFGVFALVLALLAVQVRAGRDSALGAGTPVVAAAPAEPPRRIVIRRIVRTTVITHAGAGDRTPSTAAQPAPTSPAPAAPAPVAPAAAPAPVTTRAS